MISRVEVKPLSVNSVWKGKRFKTDTYKDYEYKLLFMLPRIKLPEPPYEIFFWFGFSSTLSDWDNPIKPLQDVLSKKYKFNDKLIKKGGAEIELVEKGKEYFEFEIRTYLKTVRI